MPVMDGIEATEKLKVEMEENTIPRIPIIGISAHC